MTSRFVCVVVLSSGVLACGEDRTQPDVNARSIVGNGRAETDAGGGGAGGGGGDTGIGGRDTTFDISCCALRTLAVDATCGDCVQLAQDEPSDACGVTRDECVADTSCATSLATLESNCAGNPSLECVREALSNGGLGNGLLEAHLGCLCASCATTCGPLADARCASDVCICGDGFCDEGCGEREAGCLADCTATCECGNGQCEAYCNEDSTTCANDCFPCACGDGECDAACDETPDSCSADCAPECLCGDGECSDTCGEDSLNCETDCGRDSFP